MQKAPDFTLPDQNGTSHTLSDYRGKWVVVYFYPKDETPGCTAQACSFRDGRQILEDNHITVLGISADSVESHKKFADKHDLNFTLLSDPDKRVIQAYDSYKPKKMFGKEFLGIHRNTFIINPEGEIAKQYTNVKPEGHAFKIIQDVKSLRQVGGGGTKPPQGYIKK